MRQGENPVAVCYLFSPIVNVFRNLYFLLSFKTTQKETEMRSCFVKIKTKCKKAISAILLFVPEMENKCFRDRKCKKKLFKKQIVKIFVKIQGHPQLVKERKKRIFPSHQT